MFIHHEAVAFPPVQWQHAHKGVVCAMLHSYARGQKKCRESRQAGMLLVVNLSSPLLFSPLFLPSSLLSQVWQCEEGGVQ